MGSFFVKASSASDGRVNVLLTFDSPLEAEILTVGKRYRFGVDETMNGLTIGVFGPLTGRVISASNETIAPASETVSPASETNEPAGNSSPSAASATPSDADTVASANANASESAAPAASPAAETT
jgi:hypothetical protein